MAEDQSLKMTSLSGERIVRQLDRVLASREFHASHLQVEFLKFVVNRAIEGRADQIKGYTVATQVFGRGPDFDQNIDPIVSIQANKLRRALERYYLTAGKSDPVRIDIPKGAYVPVFKMRTFMETPDGGAKDNIAEDDYEVSRPGVLVRPFQNFSADPACSHWGIGLAMELATELTRYPDIRVLAGKSESQACRNDRHPARFEIEGGVFSDKLCVKVAIQLKDTHTGVQIWSDTYRSQLDAGGLISMQERVARSVAVKVASEYGLISRAMIRKSKNHPPKKPKAYEAILRFYGYLLDHSLENFYRAFAALTHAVEAEPECGQAWSMLGRLYADIYSLDIPGYESPLELAHQYARRGVALAPESQRCRAVLAYVHLFRDELLEGLAEVEKAIALNPNCLFVLDGLGYLMTLLGEWDRGTALIRRMIRLNPFYGTYVHYALWVDWLRQEKYKEAYLETLNLNKPNLFWDPLCRAASLGLIGRIQKGKKEAAGLLKLKPDFREKGRRLIRHYIKFEEIVDRVIGGLSRVGIEIA